MASGQGLCPHPCCGQPTPTVHGLQPGTVPNSHRWPIARCAQPSAMRNGWLAAGSDLCPGDVVNPDVGPTPHCGWPTPAMPSLWSDPVPNLPWAATERPQPCCSSQPPLHRAFGCVRQEFGHRARPLVMRSTPAVGPMPCWGLPTSAAHSLQPGPASNLPWAAYPTAKVFDHVQQVVGLRAWPLFTSCSQPPWSGPSSNPTAGSIALNSPHGQPTLCCAWPLVRP